MVYYVNIKDLFIFPRHEKTSRPNLLVFLFTIFYKSDILSAQVGILGYSIAEMKALRPYPLYPVIVVSLQLQL